MKKKIKKFLVFSSMLFISLILSYLPRAYGEDIQSGSKSEIKVMEGFISSDSMRPIALNGGQNLPVFFNDTGKIYAITKITKAAAGTHLKHLWFLRDQIILEATIPLKENQMKAVSGLILKSTWFGKWRVDVTTDDGTLLYSIPFVIHKKPEIQQAASESLSANQKENGENR